MAAEEGEGAGVVMDAVSSVLVSLAEQRKVAYSLSSIRLVSTVENKYPLADTIMKGSTGAKINGNLGGPGSAEFNDGHTYKGDFHNGVMHGKGQYSWNDGVVYEGDFADCKLTGLGSYTWLDGSTYSGDVVDSLRHGHGVFHSSCTGGTYTGQWVRGKRHGQGKLVYDTEGETYYDGEWVNNQQEGYGFRRYRSGNAYDGDWHHNERHGEGTMHWYDRGEQYSGQWVNGIQHGHGEYMWIIKRSDNAQYPLCNRYVGDWRNGVREGSGTFHYANGAVYSGEWHSNQKHGRGKFVAQSGQVFEGVFQFDRMVGGALRGTRTAGLGRPKTPLGSLIGDIDHSDLAAGGSVTEKFNMEISRLLPIDSDTRHELQQVHCVLLRFITQLKKVYHCYSSLGGVSSASCGGTVEGGRVGMMSRLQFWRLLKDCQIHHLGLTLFDTDLVIDPSSQDSHDPHTTFLMREFLQALVFLAHHIYNEIEKSDQQLCWCLSELLTTHILPKACTIGGVLYNQPTQLTQLALDFQNKACNVYKKITQECPFGKKNVRLRDVVLLLKECDLITPVLDASAVVRILVKDNPQAVDGEDYNLELEVTFLEFFEALLECAIIWYKGELQHRPRRQKSVEVMVVVEEVDTTQQADPNNMVEEQPADLESTHTLHTTETPEHSRSDDGSLVSDTREDKAVVKSDNSQHHQDKSSETSCSPTSISSEVQHWKDMLQAFFVEQLFTKTTQ